jgi:hypothetical protein
MKKVYALSCRVPLKYKQVEMFRLQAMRAPNIYSVASWPKLRPHSLERTEEQLGAAAHISGHGFGRIGKESSLFSRNSLKIVLLEN